MFNDDVHTNMLQSIPRNQSIHSLLPCLPNLCSSARQSALEFSLVI